MSQSLNNLYVREVVSSVTAKRADITADEIFSYKNVLKTKLVDTRLLYLFRMVSSIDFVITQMSIRCIRFGPKVGQIGHIGLWDKFGTFSDQKSDLKKFRICPIWATSGNHYRYCRSRISASQVRDLANRKHKCCVLVYTVLVPAWRLIDLVNAE